MIASVLASKILDDFITVYSSFYKVFNQLFFILESKDLTSRKERSRSRKENFQKIEF